jgi:hypothetical protein
VFCAVTAVIAHIPYTPRAAKVLRSAWIPAPPPESEPAMVSALAVRLTNITSLSPGYASEVLLRLC